MKKNDVGIEETVKSRNNEGVTDIFCVGKRKILAESCLHIRQK